MFGPVNPSHACSAGPSRSRGHGRPRRSNFHDLQSFLGNNADMHIFPIFKEDNKKYYDSKRASTILDS